MRSGTILIAALAMTACGARDEAPSLERTAVNRAKELAIGGKGQQNPVPDTEAEVKEGAKHFQHHCQMCHGLDGQKTGVPFADTMDPPVADLASKRVQDYEDGQLKWIIENGIRFSGMPAWKGMLDDQTMWRMVRFMRKLPPKGSLGAPQLYQETPGHLHSNGTAGHTHR
jgi:mono/diheme cytochrome c family protein